MRLDQGQVRIGCMLATNEGLTLKAVEETLNIFKKMSDLRRLPFGNDPLVLRGDLVGESWG